MEVGTIKNHNKQIKTREKKTRKKKQMKRKTYSITKRCQLSPRKAPNFNLQNEKGKR
jgi:hypothetical protein